MRGNLSTRVDRLEADNGTGRPGAVYRVILDEGLTVEARDAEIRAQLAEKGVSEIQPNDLLIIRELISAKREGLPA
jgi:hypothetical protein